MSKKKKTKMVEVYGLTIEYINGDTQDFEGVDLVAYRDGLIDLYSSDNEIDPESGQPYVDFALVAQNVFNIQPMN
jgi:hypothetical protein